MKPEAEEFLSKIIKDAVIGLNTKYRAGAKKHKNNLFDLSLEELVQEALQENFDQYTYLKAIEKKLDE